MRARLVYIARGARVLEALFFLAAGRIIVGKNEMHQMRMLLCIFPSLHLLLPRPVSFLHPPFYLTPLSTIFASNSFVLFFLF